MKTPTAAQLDQQRVKEMKRLLATAGGEKAVQQRYGEGSTSSPEFKAAMKQREAIRRRQQDAQRDEAHRAETTKKAQPTQADPSRGQSQRDRMIADRKAAQQQEREQSRSR